ncbi:MAG TPA: Mut7-C RNAse domain-containing protein [bacterium]|nr:Mut7-C RNAse domain-containing protein [bacterium]
MAADAVDVRCYAELNDRLPQAHRQRAFRWALPHPPTVGGLLGALHLPEADVDLALVNGRSVGFAERLRPGDRVALYPVFEALDISAVTRLAQRPLRSPRFLVDVHLGALARLLRLLGFDALWRGDWADAELVRIATDEGRILLSRDRRLLAQRAVTRGYRPPAAKPREQLAAVCARFELLGLARPFTRCTVCNAPVEPVAKAAVLHRLPARTRAAHDRFFRCTGCDRVYWEGSHHRRMQALLDWLAARLASEAPGA